MDVNFRDEEISQSGQAPHFEMKCGLSLVLYSFVITSQYNFGSAKTTRSDKRTWVLRCLHIKNHPLFGNGLLLHRLVSILEYFKNVDTFISFRILCFSSKTDVFVISVTLIIIAVLY